MSGYSSQVALPCLSTAKSGPCSKIQCIQQVKTIKREARTMLVQFPWKWLKCRTKEVLLYLIFTGIPITKPKT
jgi:hypothetical protein